MFILLGKKSRIIKIYPDIESKCECCNSPTQDFIVNQTYYHIYGIPVIPLLKSVNTYCDNCMNIKENVHNQQTAIFESKTRTPIYLYSISIIVFLLLAISIIRGLL